MDKSSGESTLLVIFGITGDLAHRKLLPALNEIKKAGQLADNFMVLGLSRHEITAEQIVPEGCEELVGHIDTMSMAVDQSEEYQNLKNKIESYRPEQVLFYFAVPPMAVLPIIENLGRVQLNGPHTKILLEKPFGVDLGSAKNLIEQIDKYYKEEQVFRIDHYLAKEMAQTITQFLANNTLKDYWNNQYIESIKIEALQTIGIEGRAAFYEATGALRDFVQSHLLQLAALVLMKPCIDQQEMDEMPQRRLEALNAIEPVKSASQVARAQYDTYRTEVNNPNSVVETFVDMHIKSSDPRWVGVPIQLVTGKSLDKMVSQISIKFKTLPDLYVKSLVFRIQPDEAIILNGQKVATGHEKEHRSRDAYELVIIEGVRSNHSLFASSDEVLSSWRILQPILDMWQIDQSDLRYYHPGSSTEQVLSS